MDCHPWGRYESDTTERLHFHFSLSCIGEGNGNPLQCSRLENPKDRGAWWAAVYGVAQSQTRLKRLSSSSSNTPQHNEIFYQHLVACLQRCLMSCNVKRQFSTMKTFSSLPNFQKSPTQLRKLLAIIENPQRGLNTELTKLGTADRWLRYNGSVRFRKTER